MKRIKFSTLRGRLTFLIIISIMIIFVVRISTLTISQNYYYSSLWSENLNQQLNLGVSALKSPLWDFNMSNLDDIVSAFFTDPTVAQVTITDATGTLIIDKRLSIFPDSSDLITAHKKIFNEDQLLGTLTISVSTKLYTAQLIRDLSIEIITTLLILFIIFIIVNKISSFILKPIDQLLSVSESIASGNLNVQFSYKSTDEFGLLETSIEKMQVQLLEDLNKMENDRSEISALYNQTQAMNSELESMLDKVNKSYKDTILSLANAIEANDPYTRGHCERVERFSLLLANHLHLSDLEKESLSIASLLHDIGKIGVPSEILRKESPLSEEEFAKIKEHSVIGYQILKDVEYLNTCTQTILQHHERYDGKGYANGLIGEEIQLSARILSIADAFDAMTSSRAYRKTPLTYSQALKELEMSKGLQFDPHLVDHFVRCLAHEI
jgi:HD-GYP domain-containing protein (c-di-GMP phosphodiesterase class II)